MAMFRRPRPSTSARRSLAGDLALAGVASFARPRPPDDLRRQPRAARAALRGRARLRGVASPRSIDAGRDLPLGGPGARDPRLRRARLRADLASAPGVPPRVLDDWLWNRGQAPHYKARPRHRCRLRLLLIAVPRRLPIRTRSGEAERTNLQLEPKPAHRRVDASKNSGNTGGTLARWPPCIPVSRSLSDPELTRALRSAAPHLPPGLSRSRQVRELAIAGARHITDDAAERRAAQGAARASCQALHKTRDRWHRLGSAA